MIVAGVFLLSLASLLFEVLLARFFAVTQWHHFSFLVISIALFGITASGILLNLLTAGKRGPEENTERRGFFRSASPNLMASVVCFFSITVLAAFFLIRKLPLDTFRLAVQPSHLLYLVVSFLLLSLPFFASGFATVIAYSYLPHSSGSIYFATMSGSAIGALLPLGLIPIIGLGRAILASAFLPAFLFLLLRILPLRTRSAASDMSRPLTRRAGNALLLLIAAASAVLFFLPEAARIDPSPYKALSHYRQFPDTEVLETADTVRGRMDRVASPYIRFAPGLSLQYREILPEQSTVLRDGDAPTVLYGEDQTGGYAFASHLLSYGAFAVSTDAEDVLILHQGGGTAIPSALAAEASRVTVAVEVPYLAGEILKHYRHRAVDVITENPRTYLESAGKLWDIIWVENWGSSLPGMESLTEEHLLTVEAVRSCLSRLKPSGILLFNRRIQMPPSDSLRLVATVLEALSPRPAAEKHILMIRNYDTYALMARGRPFSAAAVGRLDEFVKRMNFDWVYHAGIQRDAVNRFNVMQEPFYFDAVQNVISDADGEFRRTYPLDIRPQTDDQPYFNRFLRWGKLGELLRGTDRSANSLLLTGEVLVVFLFFIALLISFLLLILPVIVSAGRIPVLSVYFLFLGGGFMFFEIAYLEEYTFLLGDPVISFSFVLACILLFSGLAGYASDRLSLNVLKYLLAGLVVLALVSFWVVPAAVQALLSRSLLVRGVVAVLLLIPPSVLMGFPFPMAIRFLIEKPGQRAYAWAANGSTSVLTSILAMQIALVLGISRLFLFAGVCYLGAAFILLLTRGRSRRS
jgi:hypothetical protein